MSEPMSAKAGQELITAVEGMQRKIDALERKVDTLIRDLRSDAVKGAGPSRPRREFDQPGRPPFRRKFEGKREEGSGEGKFYSGYPFGQKKAGGKGGMKRGKKPFGKSSKGFRGKH